MKEHSFFLGIGFTPKDTNYIQQAEIFRNEFSKLLWEVVSISDGVISNDVVQSGEIVTPYTLNAEMASYYYTGVHIPLELTREEMKLSGDNNMAESEMLNEKVYAINEKAIKLIRSLIKFKSTILNNVLACKMFTVNYPLLIDHIMREAKLYLQFIQGLQSGSGFDINEELFSQEVFWNRIMAEHAKFIRGLLDPTEEELMNMANNFANEFDQLLDKSKEAMDMTTPNSDLTDDTIKATIAIRDFKEKGTQGLLECKIKSIIIPLLGDHTLREANHYLRLLNILRG
jgi:hypothetical protein